MAKLTISRMKDSFKFESQYNLPYVENNGEKNHLIISVDTEVDKIYHPYMVKFWTSKK